MQFRLRTLLIVLALGPPVLAGAGWARVAWRQAQIRELQRQYGGLITIPAKEP